MFNVSIEIIKFPSRDKTPNASGKGWSVGVQVQSCVRSSGRWALHTPNIIDQNYGEVK